MLKNIPGRNEEDESQLLKRARNGDAEAFGGLYERHLDSVFRFFYSRLDNRQDAEDLTEETFFRVWRSLPNFEDQGVPFLAYIFHIARNLLVDHRRRAANSGSLIALEEEMAFKSQANPSEVALNNIQHQEIKRALEKLKDDYQLVLVTRFLSELSTEEVAQILGRSTGAVRVLQHRALHALKKLVS